MPSKPSTTPGSVVDMRPDLLPADDARDLLDYCDEALVRVFAQLQKAETAHIQRRHVLAAHHLRGAMSSLALIRDELDEAQARLGLTDTEGPDHAA